MHIVKFVKSRDNHNREVAINPMLVTHATQTYLETGEPQVTRVYFSAAGGEHDHVTIKGATGKEAFDALQALIFEVV